MQHFEMRNTSAQRCSRVIKVRCPHCSRNSTFESIEDNVDIFSHPYMIGERRCPNDECLGVLFFVYNSTDKNLQTFPSEVIDFDVSNIPQNITHTFKEAIVCHSHKCYISSAIMIRRTLEEICFDREASGNSLKERIKNLGEKITVPKELLEGLDELRLLGNDAAHVAAMDFNEIGTEEVEIGIEFTKEILKAVYQYVDLLKRMRGLKKDKEIK